MKKKAKLTQKSQYAYCRLFWKGFDNKKAVAPLTVYCTFDEVKEILSNIYYQEIDKGINELEEKGYIKFNIDRYTLLLPPYKHIQYFERYPMPSNDAQFLFEFVGDTNISALREKRVYNRYYYSLNELQNDVDAQKRFGEKLNDLIKELFDCGWLIWDGVCDKDLFIKNYQYVYNIPDTYNVERIID